MADTVIRYTIDTSRRSQTITAPTGASVVAAYTHGGQAFLELIGDVTASYENAYTLILAGAGSDAADLAAGLYYGHIELNGKPVSVYLLPYTA